MHRQLTLLALVLLLGCPATDDDDTTPTPDDDDTVADDDDSGPDDDDVVPDDDDSSPDDDDVAPDDDDSGPDDDDVVPDDDDSGPDDDDSVPDDDDSGPDDDDSVVVDDDDTTPPPDDDDSVVADDDDTTPPPDDDDSVVADDDDTVVADDDDSVVVDDDDATPPPDDDDSVVVDDDDSVVADDDDSAAPECFDDFYEDNDSSSNPWVLFPGSYPDLTVCDGDEDWFLITLFPGEVITVDLSFAHTEGDIDAELYDPLGNLVASGISVDDDETLGPVNTVTGGPFMLVVWLDSDAGATPGNDYDLDISVGLPVCVDDTFEDNDTPANPWMVYPGTYTGLTTCEYDEDWFSIVLFPGEELTVDLSFVDAEGNINAELYDPSGYLVDDATTITDDESLGPVGTAYGGTYTLVAWLASDAGIVPGNDYDMTLAVAYATCLDDIFEDNDSSSNPFSLSPTGYSGMRVCPTDEDWFSVLLDAGDELEAALTFSHAEGDIDLYLYDPSVTELDYSVGYGDSEYVSAVATSSGHHLVRVTLPTDGGAYLGNMYAMDLTVTSPPPACPTDAYEPNNSSGAASWIPAGPSYSLNVCTGDDDWYYVWMMAGDYMSVDLYFDNSEGDVDLQWYDPYLVLVDSSTTGNDDESIGLQTVSDTGNQYIRVWLDSDYGVTPGNDYDIDVTLIW